MRDNILLQFKFRQKYMLKYFPINNAIYSKLRNCLMKRFIEKVVLDWENSNERLKNAMDLTHDDLVNMCLILLNVNSNNKFLN